VGEATAQMNKTPDTMKIDLGQNNLQKSLLLFSEAKASRVYTRLAHKKCPNLTVCTLVPYLQSYIKLEKISIIFVFVPLFSIFILISFFSFLFIFLFLDANSALLSTFGQANQ